MITKKQADDLVYKYKNFYKKEIVINNQKLYLYNYILKDYKVLSEEPLAKELRGLIITEDQIFLSVPSFFNINETEETDIKNIKNCVIKKVQQKLDGSLITPILLAGQIYCKSKGSFESIQAKSAQNIVNQSAELKYFILDCYDNNFQPFFELTGTDNKHVLDQDHKQRLSLIMVRDKEGHFVDVDKFNYKYTAESYNYTWDQLLEKQQTETGIEGFVVKYSNLSGDTKSPSKILKIKTKEFFELHKIHDEADKYNIILKRILEEDMDDMLSTVSEIKRKELTKMYSEVSKYIVHFITEINQITKHGDGNNRLSFVTKHKDHMFFSVIMKVLKGYDTKQTLIDYLLRKYRKEQVAKVFIEELTT